ETLRGVSQVFLMAFPRLFAAAELGWSTPRTRDLEGFTSRLAALAPRLLLGGGTFYDGEKAEWHAALAGYAARAGQHSVRVARVAAPGGRVPSVVVEVEGREIPAELEVIQERGPVHAGPVVDVLIDASEVRPGSS